MHIPDGFIDVKTAAATASLSAVGVGLALNQVRRELPPRRVPLLGLSAAFVFAAQMLNFPVVGGTSGHLMGSALIAALLGPGAAVVVMTTVLIIQCFLFADGGVLALGANVFNMAIVGTGSGYFAYRLVSRWVRGPAGRITAVAFAGWVSVVLASVGCAGQLAWSGTVPWPAAFTALTGVHLLIGIGEGLISALVFAAVERTRPDLVAGDSTNASVGGRWLPYGLLVVLGLVLFVAPFTCPWPDGLESVAERLGFQDRATTSSLATPAPGYVLPGISWPVGATVAAGVAGSVIVFCLAWWLGRVLVSRTRRESAINPDRV